jgi:preprotein translocase subunit SecD
MRNTTFSWLVVIVAITILSLYAIWPDNPGLPGRELKVRPGLDIQGGLRVLLAADTAAPVDPTKLDQARQIIERRVNALGVAEPVVQTAGSNRIIVELPGIRDPQAAIDTVKQTGLLEFVDFALVGGSCTRDNMPRAGQYVLTDKQQALSATGGVQPTATGPVSTAEATSAATSEAATAEATTALIAPDATTEATSASVATAESTASADATAEATAAATTEATPQATPSVPATGDGTREHPLVNPCTGVPFHTVMTGAGLGSAQAQVSSSGGKAEYVVSFTLAGNDESQAFANHTKANIHQLMAIVLDGQVLSAPEIQSELPSGGQITGNFTRDTANTLALQLRYGSLPVSLKVESTETVGASLGNESVLASVQAGLIGLLGIALFMLLYYRIPGLAAVIGLLIFAAMNFALYKFIPVTLTLPAIIGFVISIATALDGNILIFERIKEELRSGRTGEKAIELGFTRAWPSIRESNISTIMIALILYFFGGQFGASAVRGFSISLILGLVTNLFTAVVVTHTFMNLFMMIAGPKLRQTGLFGNLVKTGEEQ